MMNFTDWRSEKQRLPHDPMSNGLKYLYMYPLDQAMGMLTDPQWTRAIFVREPKERVLSAFLDKATKKNATYMDAICCRKKKSQDVSCGERASRSLHDFVTVIHDQCFGDGHWKPQCQRIDPELWRYVNFVGYFDSLYDHAKRMLQRLGELSWETYGASGWGHYRNESMFMTNEAGHRTNSHNVATLYYNDSSVIKLVEDLYACDYERFNFSHG